MPLEIFCRGTRCLICFTPAAVKSLEQAEVRVPSQKRAACKAQLFRILHRLGEGQQVRNDTLFRYEGQGIVAAKARCGLRGYGWFQTLRGGDSAFVVSHFIVKKKQRADPKDVERAVAARETWR